MLKSTSPNVAAVMLIIIMMLGCDFQQPEVSELLEKTERLIESHPDSAMILIDSLFYPEKRLSHEQCMRYIVIRAQVRHENRLALTLDTLIFDASRYYSRNNKSPRLKALAYLYSGHTCYERGDHKRATDYLKKSNIYFHQKEPEKASMNFIEQKAHRSGYIIKPEHDFQRFQSMYNTRFIRSQRWLLGLVTVLLFVAIAFLFVLGGMLKEKNAKLKMIENIDTLRKTTKDLLRSKEDDRHKITTMQKMLQWKWNVMKETIQLKYRIPEKLRKENQIILEKFEKIVFDQNQKELFSCFLSMIDNCYPGLQHFIEDRYPDLSRKECNVCLLSFAGLSVGEISVLFNQSENSIYKSRSAINQQIGQNFCTILKEEFKQDNDTVDMN